MPANETNFRYLNREGRWLDFERQGLEIRSDGALQLYAVPRLEGELPAGVAGLAAPDGPAGVAVDWDASVYYSDPSGDRVLKRDGCDGRTAPVPCMGGRNGDPTQFHTPRGVVLLKHRRALLVVDSGNHRIQVFHPESGQLLEIWGQADPSAPPRPGSGPGLFDTPWTAAADQDGNVYVVDYGNRRVQKFGVTGDVEPAFWQTMQAAGVLRRPGDIAVYPSAEKTLVYVLDLDEQKIFAFDAAGYPWRDRQGAVVSIGWEHMRHPMGLVIFGDAVYAGDNSRQRVLTFKRKDDSFEFAGEAAGYAGPVAALALDGKGRLLVHTGNGREPIALAVDGGYRTRGVLWSKPIRAGNAKVQWHRLRAESEELSARTHLEFFVYTSDQVAGPPVHPFGDDPFPAPPWHPIDVDVTDFFIGGPSTWYLWIGARFAGDGNATPVVHQMRAEYDHETYAAYLPDIYRDTAQCGDFLVRFLSLFESFFSEVEGAIGDLPALFDPAAVPQQYLPWLAAWLALELDEDWTEREQRKAVAEAFTRYARRGTVEGLRESLLLSTGVNAIIEEPILNAAWWALPAEPVCCGATTCKERSAEKLWEQGPGSVLGFTTMLAPAEAQGAVVGTTAVLDRSHLITQEEFGAPLFEDVAHQFSVQVYRGQVSNDKKGQEVRAVLDREKPAHTAYHLCLIGARMRVGFQARVGIDTVVAGPLAASKLGELQPPDAGLVLAGQPRGRIGSRIRVGKETRA